MVKAVDYLRSHEVALKTWIRKDQAPEDVEKSGSVLNQSLTQLEVVRLTNVVKQFCQREAEKGERNFRKFLVI